MYRYKAHLITALLVITSLVATAQNNTNSPYSRFGYGLLDNNTFGIGTSMGGLGYGVRSNNHINAANPASYTAIDSLTFLFDTGAHIENTWMKEGDLSEQYLNGNLDYLAMQFPLGKHMAASIGIQPFSSVGYSYGSALDNGTVTSSGSGSLNRSYLGISGELFNRLSIGVNASYLFGNLTYSDAVYPTAVTSYSMYTDELHIKDFSYQIGLQYEAKIGNDKLILGAVYTPKLALQGEKQHIKTALDVNSNIVSRDTIDSKTNGSYEMPMSLGAGLTYVMNNSLTVGADVTYQKWNDILFDGERDQLNNRLKFALGGEYVADARDRKYAKRVIYRAGTFYNQSYLNVNGNDLHEWGVSCGVGLPIIASKSYINLGLEYTNMGATKAANLIDESTLRFTMSLTFNEMWFFKRKID